MSYKVLYRKYRPSNFNDIVDQKFITDTLKESIINNKISHAYIFSGPKGTGKTSTAKVFAKAINCEHPIDGEPCCECESCINFEKNPDIGVDLGQGYHKIRMVIKGKNKGKSGGARIITYELYVKVLENETGILLVDLYDKNEIENLSESVYTSITRKFLIHRSD